METLYEIRFILPAIAFGTMAGLLYLFFELDRELSEDDDDLIDNGNF